MSFRTTLYDPGRQRDACGIGFVADVHGRPSREIVDVALEALRRLRHRGAIAADRRTGDGAGVLLPIAPALVPAPWCGLAMVFLRSEDAREGIERACTAEGIEAAGWREVPVDTRARVNFFTPHDDVSQTTTRKAEPFNSPVEVGVVRHRGAPGRAGVVDGHVDRAELGLRPVDDGADRVGLAQVALHDSRARKGPRPRLTRRWRSARAGGTRT